MKSEDIATRHSSQMPSRNPIRINFFDDATEVARGEAQSERTTYGKTDTLVKNLVHFWELTKVAPGEAQFERKTYGKTDRLVKNLVHFGELQHRWECEQQEKSFFHKLRHALPLGIAANRHNLRTWRYQSYWRTHSGDEALIHEKEKVLEGEQNFLQALVTRVLHGSSRKQLRPLQVEAAVLFAWLGASGFHFDTKLLWKYRSVFAESLGASVASIELVIRTYDCNLHDLVMDFLGALPEGKATGDNPRTTAGKTGNKSVESPKIGRHRDLAYDVSEGRFVWRTKTKAKAQNVALEFIDRLCDISKIIAELVAQFWDNVASMTYPICKFEHGKNRFIFRISSGELCTGTTVLPRLRLQEIEAGAEAGNVGAKVFGRVSLKKQKPDLQVVTSDNAIDCSINVLLGRRRVLFMRERRALRTCIVLAHYTRYNLDTTGFTPGIFKEGGVPLCPTNEGPKKAFFTFSRHPDLISLLVCNQMVSAVSRNGITVITGLLIRERQIEFLREHGALRAHVREFGEDPYSEIVHRLIEGNQKVREGSEDLDQVEKTTPKNARSGNSLSAEASEWKPIVCGAVGLLFIARSLFLLTRRKYMSDSYQLHELSDTIAYASRTSIQIL